MIWAWGSGDGDGCLGVVVVVVVVVVGRMWTAMMMSLPFRRVASLRDGFNTGMSQSRRGCSLVGSLLYIFWYFLLENLRARERAAL